MPPAVDPAAALPDQALSVRPDGFLEFPAGYKPTCALRAELTHLAVSDDKGVTEARFDYAIRCGQNRSRQKHDDH